MIEKMCSKCGAVLPLEYFHKESRSSDGRTSSCKECRNAQIRNYKLENRDDILAKKKQYYQEHKVEHMEYTKQWRVRNPDKAVEYSRIYRERNPEYQRQWAAENRDKRAANEQRRRAQKNAVFIEYVDPAILRVRDGDNCYLCFDLLSFGTPRAVHIEHRIPLSRGGEHSYANCALACAECNRRKYNKTEEEYREIIQKEMV